MRVWQRHPCHCVTSPSTVVPRTELTPPSTHLSGLAVFRARNLHGEEPKGKKTKLLTKKKNF